MTTRVEIEQWCAEAKDAGATHVIVVCDMFDWSDYPVSVMPTDSLAAMEKEYQDRDRMSKIMEVIEL